jgi:hypothetical protein
MYIAEPADAWLTLLGPAQKERSQFEDIDRRLRIERRGILEYRYRGQ